MSGALSCCVLVCVWWCPEIFTRNSYQLVQQEILLFFDRVGDNVGQVCVVPIQHENHAKFLFMLCPSIISSYQIGTCHCQEQISIWVYSRHVALLFFVGLAISLPTYGFEVASSWHHFLVPWPASNRSFSFISPISLQQQYSYWPTAVMHRAWLLPVETCFLTLSSWYVCSATALSH